MFNKIIKNIKAIIGNLEEEEKIMLGTAFGFLFLGFLIYSIWQTRIPMREESDPTPENQVEVEGEENQEEDIEETNPRSQSTDFENNTHGYKIKGLADKIVEKNEAEIFGLRESSDFVIEYEGVTHAVFDNSDNLSIEDWIEKMIDKKGPRGESLEKQRDFLDIMLERKTQTPLGPGLEIVRMNDSQSGELFIPWKNYVLTFYYRSGSGRSISELEASRQKLIDSIEEK